MAGVSKHWIMILNGRYYCDYQIPDMMAAAFEGQGRMGLARRMTEALAGKKGWRSRLKIALLFLPPKNERGGDLQITQYSVYPHRKRDRCVFRSTITQVREFRRKKIKTLTVVVPRHRNAIPEARVREANAVAPNFMPRPVIFGEDEVPLQALDAALWGGLGNQANQVILNAPPRPRRV